MLFLIAFQSLLWRKGQGMVIRKCFDGNEELPTQLGEYCVEHKTVGGF